VRCVEKSQYDLCVEVLRRLDKSGVLKHVVLIGSWCTLFYKSYFEHIRYTPVLKTRDIDLLIPYPSAINVKTNVAELLKDLGFVIGFDAPQGYIRLEHPGLIVEFLTIEKGRPSDKPYPLPKLGVNAQPLRFLEMLAGSTITTKVEGFSVTLPHPVNFALHKLLISQRRSNREKEEKDRAAAVQLLEALISKGEQDTIKTVFISLPSRWQNNIKKALQALDNNEISDILN
jgi:hypothetical protein